jgi:sigma-B regulation protein RsbU (phosphoserine phosphatase)
MEPDIKHIQEENRKLHRAVEELSILNDLALAISSTMDLGEIMKLIVKKCIKTIRVEQGTVTLLAEQETAPMKTLIRGTDSGYGQVSYRIGTNLTGWMVKNQKPLLMNDLRNDPRFRTLKDEDSHIRSVLSVPLKVKDRLIGSVNLFNKQGGDFTEEDQRLLSIIATQSAQVIENARLYEEEREKERMMRDLLMAQQIQKSLLPRENPSFPGMDIAGRNVPAHEVGGDYFDFIPLENDLLAITLGDVSGKGISAALLMSNVHATLRSQARTSSCTTECIGQVNRLLHSCTDSEKFVTLFYGVLDPAQKVLRYTNAGHNPPILIDPQGSFTTLDIGGIVLAALPQFPYQEGEVRFKPGQILVIYSDGVTEATDEQEEQFGEERLIRTVLCNAGLPASSICDEIIEAVRAFSTALPHQDDITLVVAKIL